MKKLETRSFVLTDLQTREENGIGIVEGRPIVYDSPTDIGGYFREIIARKALDSADLTDVRLCMNHDTGYVYARSRRNNPNSTMQLIPDDEGMKIRANLDINSSPKAQDLYSAVKRGDIDSMSFMFDISDEEWQGLDGDYPTRTITGIRKVYEVSAVAFPAYKETSISARSQEALESARAALESAKKQAVKESLDNDIELLKAKIKCM